MSNKYVSPSALQHYDEKIKEVIEEKIKENGSSVEVDSALSSTSTNPVQNKVINSALDDKVDKVSGKGLSTNDLTSALKTNYDTAYTHSQSSHAPTTAEKNVIVGVQKNGTDLTVNSSTRKVNITVPTKVSELTNDSGFKTTDTVTTVTTTGSGNAITALSATNGAITATKGSTFLTAHPTISKSTDTTSTATATHGGTITMVDSITRDGNGHVTNINTKTVTLPTDNNTVYTHPTYTAKSNGLYKVTVDSTGHVSGTTAVAKSDITALGIPAQDTTYSNFVKSGSSAKAGLVPAPSTTAGTTKYLREDGTWATPPDTKYTLPTASSSTLGGVKTTSTVTSTSGLTACPIISGVPYYKDTTSSTTLSGLGVTATAAELNYTDGVTSNIQTQLDDKLSKSTGGGVLGSLSVATVANAPITTISTNCNLSGGMVKTSPGGNTEITYGVTITDPSTDGSRATINGHKIYHEGNLAIPFNTELVFGNKGTINRGFIKATPNSLLIKAPTSTMTTNPMESKTDTVDHGGAGLRFSYCSSGILPYSTFNTSSTMNLGSSSLKFGTIYSVASALNSDVKLKKDIESLSDESDKYLKTFDELDFVKFRWKQNMNGGLATPSSSRYHLGLIAQEVEQTFENNGIHGGDSGAIQANFFADNTSEAWISGGYQIPKEGYSYSENVWNYKHDLEYEWTNEIIEKDFSELNNTGAYNIRPNIQYIMFEDISKVAADGKQPPLKVNSITLVTKDDEYIELELTENGISYYDHDNDTELTIPLSNATLNDDGSLFINFNKMWSTYMLEVPTFAFADYKTLILDVDYIGEYKCYLIPEGEYKNANVWDRGNNDKILYDYTLNYNEIYALSLYALQETRKEYMEYKAKTEATINELTEKVNLLMEKVGE